MSQSEQIRISIEQKKETIVLGDAIARISKSRDWKRIIDSEFFDKEPARLVHLMAHPDMQDEASQKEIHNQMLAIAYFRSFLGRTQYMAELARKALPEDEKTQVELLQEEVQE